MRKTTETIQPKITKVKGLQSVEIGGEPKLVQEIVTLDYGPERGTSKVYIMAERIGEANWGPINAVLRKYGLAVDR